MIVQRLTESVVVAVVGGAIGSAVAYWGVQMLLAVSPESLARTEEVRFDARLLAFAFAVTVLTGLLFGAAPAVRASMVAPVDAMRDGAGSRGVTSGRRSRSARSMLVASQVALALMLLVGTGVLIRSFLAKQRVDFGFAPAGVMTFEVNLPLARYPRAADRVQFHDAFRQRLGALPGVTRVAATSWLPANGKYHVWGMEYVDASGADRSLAANVRVTDGDYLGTLGIPLVSGRWFSDADRADTTGVTVLSRTLARRAFGDRDPLGQIVRTGDRRFTVIGVADDVANEPANPTYVTLYLSHQEFANDRNWTLIYLVRARLGESELLTLARGALARIDPGLVLYRPRTFESVLSRHLARDRFTLLLMSVFGAVALSLAAIGVYGVLSYMVSQRTREIGVRMALGAQRGQVRAIVMGHALAVASVGLVAGLAGAVALGGILSSLAAGVRARDPVVYAAVAAVLILAVLAAGYLPARRATRVEPLEALR
jgi:putative ABC transport system permease protein